MCWIVAISVLLSVLAFLVWASTDVGSNVYVKTLCRSNTDSKHIALTFDDGPDEEMTPRVLDVLHQYNVKATFFLIGNKAERYPDIVRRMVEEGHTVAIHTYSHRPTFPLSNYATVVSELQDTRKAIIDITGKSPRLFRPPFGVTNLIIGKAVRYLGLQTIGWSIRSLDTVNSRRIDKTVARVCKRLHPGGIVLLHDRLVNADVLLDTLINEMLKRGYRAVTLDELLNIEPYEH